MNHASFIFVSPKLDIYAFYGRGIPFYWLTQFVVQQKVTQHCKATISQ